MAANSPVILEHSKGRSVERAGKGKAKLQKKFFSLSGLVGSPYGATFAADKGGVKRKKTEFQAETKYSGN